MLPSQNASSVLLHSLRRYRILPATAKKFTISGNEIKFLQSWAHLGHIVFSTMNNENDITRSRHNLIRKLNEVLSTFRELDSFVKVRLIIVRVYTAVSYKPLPQNISLGGLQ